ncbi:Putative transposase (fragment) [Bradyrhizobium sp. ORS 285]
MQAMGMSGISKSLVSRLCGEIANKSLPPREGWGEGLPHSSDRRRLAVSVDRRHLREGAAERAHCLDRGDRPDWRQQRRPARGARHGPRPIRGRDVLDRIPPQARRRGLRGAKHVISDAHQGIKATVA